MMSVQGVGGRSAAATPQVVDAAGDIAHYLMAGNPERLRHTEAVVEKALLLTSAVADDEAPLLVGRHGYTTSAMPKNCGGAASTRWTVAYTCVTRAGLR